MTLEWSDSGGGSGTVTASPQNDSFYLPVSTNSPANLTLKLRTTSTQSICPQPLYLLTWSPAIEASGAAQATISGSICYAVEWEDEGGSVGISYDLSNRPCKAEPSELELAPRLNPFPGEPRLVFTPNGNTGGAGPVGGSLSAKAPGAFAIPRAIQMGETASSSSRLSGGISLMSTDSTSGGGDGGVFIFFDPAITYGDGHSGGCGSVLHFDSETGIYSETYDYPLDSKCLWRNWHRDATGAYSCTCEAKITYGDESLRGYFAEDIEYNIPGVHATGTIRFGGNPIWQGEATHHVADDCSASGVELLSSDECDPCFSGCADGNCDGLEGDALGSLAFRISLGMPRDGQISGFLWFKTTEPLSITPATLNLLARDDAAITDTTVGGVRTVVCSDTRGRTAVIEPIANGVRVTLRKTADNSLEHIWEIINVDGDPNEIQLRKISRLDNDMRDVTYEYRGDGVPSPSWTRVDNISQSSEQIIRTDGLNDPESGILHEARIVRDVNNAILSHTVTESRRYGFGESAVIREIYHAVLSFDENWVEDSATYWEDTENRRINGRPRLIWGESRPWSYQTYDTEGRERLRLDQWDGSAVPMELSDLSDPSDLSDLSDFPDLTAIATVSDYTPLPGDSSHGNDLDAVRTESRYLVRNGTPTQIGRTWHVYTHGTDTFGRATVTVQTIRAGSQEAAIGDPGNAVSSRTSFDNDAAGIPLLLHGRSVSSTDEDGTTTTYDYTLGEYDAATHDFTVGGSATALRTLVSTSTAAAPDGIPGKSTQSLTIQDATHGTTLYSATLLRSTGNVLSWQANVHDDKNRLRFTQYSDGSSTTNAYSCCRLLWKIDRNGFKTLRSAVTGKDHLYYAIEEVSLREITENHPTYYAPARHFWVTQHFMDALGRETNTVTKTARTEGIMTNPNAWTPEYPRFTDTTFYPYGTSDYSVQTDRLGTRTIFAKTTSAQQETTVSQTFHPTNYITPSTVSSNIWYRNGHSISDQHWGSQWTRESQFTDYNEAGTRFDISVTDASDYVTPVTNRISSCDFLGRTILTVTSMGTVSNAYDGASSRLVSTTSSSLATSSTTTFLYDDLGEQVGTAKYGITDASETRYEDISGEIWRVITRWRVAGGETGGVFVVRMQMTGLSNSLRSRTVSVGENGMTNIATSAFDPATKILTSTTQTGDATPVVRKTKFGILLETQNRFARTVYYIDAFLLPYHIYTYKPCGMLLTRRLMEEIDDETWQPLRTATRLGITSSYIREQTTYDELGLIRTQTDDLGNSTTNAYDVQGRTTAVSGATYPAGYGYDTMGRMKALRTTRDGSTFDETRWLFNHVSGLVTNKLYADDSAIAYAYTDDGKPHRTTWARGVWKENAYDSQELLAGVSYSDDTPQVFMAYNDFQYLIAASNAVAQYVYEKTTLGVATNETALIAGNSYEIARGIDEYQRLQQLTVDGNELATYSYDAENCLSTVSNTAFSVAYHYTSDGYDAGYTLTLTNGVILDRAVIRDAYRRQLISLVSNQVDTAVVSFYQYDYDTLARATSRNADTFGYNARSEVTAANIASNEYAYAYDNIGNHTTSSVDSVATTYTANSLNQYSQIPVPSVPSVENLSYDLDGNLVTNGVWSYTYDAENRLTAAFSNSVCVVSNAYDYMSRRVLKVSHGGTETRRFVYDGWNLIQETIATVSGVTTNAYILGKDLSGSMQGAGGVGGLLAVKQGNAWYFPFYDANANITAYVDQSGTIVAEYTYDAFGGTISQSGSMADKFSFRFSTKYYDSETGLYYYGMRFYSPVLHRWLNRDPSGENSGLHLYEFCQNNSVNGWDFIGLWVLNLISNNTTEDDALIWKVLSKIKGATTISGVASIDDIFAKMEQQFIAHHGEVITGRSSRS